MVWDHGAEGSSPFAPTKTLPNKGGFLLYLVNLISDEICKVLHIYTYIIPEPSFVLYIFGRYLFQSYNFIPFVTINYITFLAFFTTFKGVEEGICFGYNLL